MPTRREFLMSAVAAPALAQTRATGLAKRPNIVFLLTDDQSYSSLGCMGNRYIQCNETHESRTDPTARLYRKSNNTEAKLCYLGHVITENRNGMVSAHG